MSNSFHIQRFEAHKANDNWPTGGWSLYKIDGEQIANRTVWERVNPKGWYEGEIIARHAWCGFIGIFATLPEVMAEIEKALEK